MITSGLFKYTRNPNYLGEVLIYVCFCILSGHWLPWVCCSSIWVWMFIPNMLNKDKRMSRHQGWKAYTDQSWLLVPKVSTPDLRACRESARGHYDGLLGGKVTLCDLSVR